MRVHKAVAKQLFTNKGIPPTEQNHQANAIIKWQIPFSAGEFIIGQLFIVQIMAS